MPKVDRNNPIRGTASESRYSLMEFERDFPDDATCLDYLLGMLYPDGIYCPTCQKVTKHHRDRKRPSYSCQWCGHREHPLVGTIFERSATSLRLWFYGIYLMSSTRCGISAKQLERELGVTYKTAWRMFNKIRTLLRQDETPLDGTVEVDEAFIGGKAKWRNESSRRGRPAKYAGRGTKGKTPVQGMHRRATAERSGKLAAHVVTDAEDGALAARVSRRVMPGSTVYTDEHRAYQGLTRSGYRHDYVTHSAKVYVSGDVHTNTVEGFWSLLKRGISGVYHGVGEQWLQSYVDEYVFRYNNRDDQRGMFNAFVSRIEKASPEAAS